nr:hypothetical protein [Tanacetum cinerariifolium]
DVNENLFIPASMGYDHEMVLKSKDWVERYNPDSKLPNFNPGRILVPESQVVNECLKPTEALNDLELSKDSEVKSLTLLPPLKNLQGASPSSKVMSLIYQPHSLKGEKPGLGHNCVILVRGGALAESFQPSESSIGKFDAKDDDGYFLGYSFNSKAFRVFNIRRQQVDETYHVTFDESMEAIRFTNTSVDEIRINESSRYPPDEYHHEDDPSRKYQSNSNISYYIIPHGRSLTELTQEKHAPEVIALNEQDNPHNEVVEGPPNTTNIDGIQEQNVQDEQICNQPIKETLGNNTKTSVPITESLVPKVIQSQNTNHASTSSYHVAQDRWSKYQHIEHVNVIGDLSEGMLTRSMAVKLTATLASECLFADFLSKIEPKKVSKVLKHLGWADAIQEKLNQFYSYSNFYGKTAIGSKWVFKNKKDKHGITTKNKARLVAQGYIQEEAINNDETFALVARIEAIRIFLAFATYMNFIPPSFDSSEFPDYVCKLDKALYGLKQSPKTCLMCKISVQSKGIPSNCYEKNPQSMAMSLAKAEYVAAAGLCKYSMDEQLTQETLNYTLSPTEYQLVVIFAKPLDEPTFTRLKAELGMVFPSMVSDECTVKTTSLLEGPHRDKDSEGLKPPVDMEPLTNPVTDLSGTGANGAELQLKTFIDVQALLLSDDEMVQASNNEEVFAAGEEIDEDIPPTDEEATINFFDNNSIERDDLLKALNEVTEIVKAVQETVKEDHALNKQVLEATETYTTNSYNITELLSLAKTFDFSSLKPIKTPNPKVALVESSSKSPLTDPILKILVSQQTDLVTQREGKVIDADEQLESTTKKLVPASKVIQEDLDEPIRVPYMINEKMNYLTNDEINAHLEKEDKIKKAVKEAKRLEITKTEVIKIVQEEAKKIGIDPKKIISAKAGVNLKVGEESFEGHNVRAVTDRATMWDQLKYSSFHITS